MSNFTPTPDNVRSFSNRTPVLPHLVKFAYLKLSRN